MKKHDNKDSIVRKVSESSNDIKKVKVKDKKLAESSKASTKAKESAPKAHTCVYFKLGKCRFGNGC
jgi:hypothetical protein